MERFLGLDVGNRRIGVAVSDELGLIAQPVETYTRVGYGPDIRHFRELSLRYGTKQIVCGLPRNLNGSSGFQIEEVRAFAKKLEEAGFAVQFEDERLTTVLADRLMLEDDLKRKDRKAKVDMVAASIILQSWLDRNRSAIRSENED